KEEAGIQLQAEEYDLMAATADLDDIEEVNANCILMANLQQASTSGTLSDSTPIYDTDRSAEVHKNYDNEIFNMFTQEEKYTELLEPIPELHQLPQNDYDVVSEVTGVEQGGETVEQHPANFEKTRALYDSLYQNLATEVEKVNSVNRNLKETNAKLTTELARYKNQERCFQNNQEKYKKLEKCYQQSVYQEQCLSKKINALHLSTGYQNPFYLKQAQKKQQSLYDGKMLLDKHDPPVVHDSEETLQLAQESRDKMKQMNKEIKPANYTKINHLSRVFVPQKALSLEELYFSNNSKTASVLKSFLIPNEDLSDDTTPSVARKFLNEVKSTILTLQRVVKQRMTIETHNWASSAHQEFHKIVREEIFPIVNQVDARLQNFEIQFLKEAAKFIGDFKSLTKEADDSLAKHKETELDNERLLKAVVSQDVMNIVQKESVVDTSDLQTELERTKERFENCIIKKETEYAKLWNDWYKKCNECKYDKISYDKAYKDMQQKIERLQAQLGDLKGKCKDTSCVSDTQNQLSQKLENANASDHKDNTQNTSKNTKFAKQPIGENFPKVGKTNALSKPVTSNSVSTPQVSKGVNNAKVIAPGMFRISPKKISTEAKKVPNTVNASFRTKPITVSQPDVITKKNMNSDLNGLSSTGLDNTKTRRPQPRSNTKNDRVPSASKSSQSKNKEAKVEEHHRNLLLSKNNEHMSSACNNFKLDSQDVKSKVVCAVCKKCLNSVNHDVCLNNYVNGKKSRGRKHKANVSKNETQQKNQPKIKKSKKVEFIKRHATPKPRKSRILLRWSPTGRLFDQDGKISDSSESKSQSDCSNGDNACTSNTLEPKNKWFPNSTSLLG
nr:hypothetical protein [Tanacetum cinerariifolium]